MPYPQTFKGIQDAVIAKLRLTDNATNRGYAKDWINQAYAQVCEEAQALQQAGTATLTSGQSTYTLPVEIIELKTVVAKGVSDTGYGPPLRRVSLDELLQWRQANQGTNVSTSGSVSGYALVGLNQLELYPAPSGADTIEFYYSYRPVALVADADTPVLQEPWASRVLEYGALAQGAELQSDPLGPTWDAKYQDWKLRFQVHMGRRGGAVDQFPVASSSRLIPRDRSTDMGY